MKLGRLILSLIGLVAITLAYVYHNLYFLVIAVVAFFAGLYLMGAGRRTGQKVEGDRKGTSSSGKRKDSGK